MSKQKKQLVAVEIDRLTESISLTETGENFPTSVLSANENDLNQASKANG